MNTYVLIGAGMGTEQMLTEQAQQAIHSADIVLSTGRLADGLAAVRTDMQTVAFSQLAQRHKRARERLRFYSAGIPVFTARRSR